MQIALLLIAGFLLLVAGAESLVRGASRLAVALGISPLIVGLTIVAIGTSAPELAVGIRTTLAGHGDLLVGNVVGSNICNTLLILGLGAVIVPLRISQRLIRLDVPIMIGVSALFLLFSLHGGLSHSDGIILLALMCLYFGICIKLSKRESPKVVEEYTDTYALPRWSMRMTILVSLGLVILGACLLILGARWLVDGAVQLAIALGMSELIIGLTIIAIGTSLPEIATSIIAAMHGENDIAAGNVVGSNLMNILAVMGIASMLAPGGITVPHAALTFDIPVMIACAVACLPIFFTGHMISRWEGVVFLAYYAAYLFFLLLNAQGHEGLPFLQKAMLLFVLPATFITLGIFAVREGKSRSDPKNQGI